MYRLLLITLFCLTIFTIKAQPLYQPRDIQKGYKQGTRSVDGRPGKNYWQNFGRYDITVSVKPPNRTITGNEQITYINNSPDTLAFLIIKLIQNIHKPEVARNLNASGDYLTSGIQINSFLVNGQKQPWPDSKKNTTVQKIALSKSLLPKDSVKLHFSWQFEVSKQSGREGMIDSTTFFLAYFYPRVAVYDDYAGWDQHEFTDQQEFYNDFNDYTLTVNAPKNFIVWATGTLQNPHEVLQLPFAKRLSLSLKSDSVIHIATKEELAAKQVTQQNEENSWKFKSDNISDVAFALSNHYLWDAASTIVDNSTQGRASVQSAYSPDAKDFPHSVKWGCYALNWYSHQWPGIPYPFPKMTIFQGGADMEYPMMINDSSFPNLTIARRVEDHEIAHTWFPFYMGINEYRYAFMDEGWATVHEYLIGLSYLPADTINAMFKRNRVSNWYKNTNPGTDLPIITPSYELRGSYRPNAYGKPALAYLALKDLLGDELFKKCLHTYMQRWNGKHPTPWDFFNTFNNISGKNLNWFWQNWFFANHYIDLAVGNLRLNKQAYTFSVKNIGGFPVPFNLEISYTDGTKETIHKTSAVWSINQKEIQINLPFKKNISTIKLEGNIFMDADISNNRFDVVKSLPLM